MSNEKMKPARPLCESIEMLHDADTRDDDVAPYITEFFRKFRDNVAMAPTDLLSADNAARTVKDLAVTTERLNQQLRMIQSLRKMLESKKLSTAQ